MSSDRELHKFFNLKQLMLDNFANPIPVTKHMTQENNTSDTNTKKVLATKFLDDAAATLKERAVQRDAGGAGERSMARTVAAWNAMTGKNMTEAEGWEFMILLKLVRGRQGAFREDDYTDGSAYCALLGECESQVK